MASYSPFLGGAGEGAAAGTEAAGVGSTAGVDNDDNDDEGGENDLVQLTIEQMSKVDPATLHRSALLSSEHAQSNICT